MFGLNILYLSLCCKRSKHCPGNVQYETYFSLKLFRHNRVINKRQHNRVINKRQHNRVINKRHIRKPSERGWRRLKVMRYFVASRSEVMNRSTQSVRPSFCAIFMTVCDLSVGYGAVCVILSLCVVWNARSGPQVPAPPFWFACDAMMQGSMGEGVGGASNR